VLSAPEPALLDIPDIPATPPLEPARELPVASADDVAVATVVPEPELVVDPVVDIEPTKEHAPELPAAIAALDSQHVFGSLLFDATGRAIRRAATPQVRDLEVVATATGSEPAAPGPAPAASSQLRARMRAQRARLDAVLADLPTATEDPAHPRR
jgi:hypothetical protein